MFLSILQLISAITINYAPNTNYQNLTQQHNVYSLPMVYSQGNSNDSLSVLAYEFQFRPFSDSFIQSEWEKGLNLIDYSNRLVDKGITQAGVVVPYSDYYVCENIFVSPNQIYSHNFGGYQYSYVFFYQGSTYLSNIQLWNTSSFAIPSYCDNIKFQLYKNLTQPMLNLGSTLYNYQQYHSDSELFDVEPRFSIG